jgi:glycosyltransferase involved in cell wall biosynthesis
VVSKLDGPVRYIYQENMGRSRARNAGFKASAGEYVCFLDSDDLFVQGRLESQVELLQGREGAGFVYCDYSFIDQAARPLDKPPIYSSHPLRRGSIFRHLLYFDFIPPSTVLARRECVEAVGLFDPTLEPTEDFDWLLRMSKRYEADYIPEPMCLIRTHPGNTSSSAIAEATMRVLVSHLSLDETKMLLGKDWRRVYRDSYLTVANYHYNSADLKRAREYYLKALRVEPSRAIDLRTGRLLLKSLLGVTVLDAARRVRERFSKEPASIL